MNAVPRNTFRQSAAIPYFSDNSGFRIVLITNSSRTAWIYRKGLIEPGMSPPESAANEAYEEAGVLGKIAPDPIDEYRDEKWGGVCHVCVYPLEVTEILKEWDERRFRKRRILDLDEAIQQVKPVQLRGLLLLRDRLKPRNETQSKQP